MKANKEILLREFLSKNLRTPFIWGMFDCVLFAARCADEIAGHEYSIPFIGTYHSSIGAAKVIKEKLGGDFMRVFDNYYKPIPPQLAGTGDIILAIPPTTMDPTYGVQDGDKIFLSTATGLTSFRCDELYCEQAWRVE